MNQDILIEQTSLEKRLRSALEPVVEHRDCELVHLRLAGGKLCLFIDRTAGDSSIKMEELESLNRLIGDTLDVLDAEEKLFKASYELEVSSPGLDRPLTRLNHFERAIGQQIRLKTSGGLALPKNVKVMLRGVNDTGIQIEWESKKDGMLEVPWSSVQEANIVYVFEEKKKPGKVGAKKAV